jgi:hypothetical protein
VSIDFVAITNYSSVPDSEITFHVEAARKVLPLLCRAWGIPQPGIGFFSQGVELPAREAAICSAVDSDGNIGSLGYHTALAGLPLFVYEASYGAWVMIHELEFLVNPQLLLWDAAPDGRLFWRECFDGTQDEYFPVDVELFGERREILAPNFTFPAWHGLPNPDGSSRLDYMGTRSRPFEIAPGGYATVTTVDGQREQIGAARADKGRSTSRSALIRSGAG